MVLSVAVIFSVNGLGVSKVALPDSTWAPWGRANAEESAYLQMKMLARKSLKDMEYKGFCLFLNELLHGIGGDVRGSDVLCVHVKILMKIASDRVVTTTGQRSYLLSKVYHTTHIAA